MIARAVLVLLVAASLGCASTERPDRTGPPVTIRGRFVEPRTGRGIAAATVTFEQRNYSFFGNISRAMLDAPSTPLGKATTDSQGNFIFKTTSPGPYEVSCFSRVPRRMGVKRLSKPPRDAVTIGAFDPGPPPLVFPPRRDT